MKAKHPALGSSRPTTHRLPSHIINWLAEAADEEGLSKSEFLIRLIQSQPNYRAPVTPVAPDHAPPKPRQGRRRKYPQYGPSVVLSVRVPLEIKDKLTRIASTTNSTPADALVHIVEGAWSPPIYPPVPQYPSPAESDDFDD